MIRTEHIDHMGNVEDTVMKVEGTNQEIRLLKPVWWDLYVKHWRENAEKIASQFANEKL